MKFTINKKHHLVLPVALQDSYYSSGNSPTSLSLTLLIKGSPSTIFYYSEVVEVILSRLLLLKSIEFIKTIIYNDYKFKILFLSLNSKNIFNKK